MPKFSEFSDVKIFLSYTAKLIPQKFHLFIYPYLNREFWNCAN